MRIISILENWNKCTNGTSRGHKEFRPVLGKMHSSQINEDRKSRANHGWHGKEEKTVQTVVFTSNVK